MARTRKNYAGSEAEVAITPLEFSKGGCSNCNCAELEKRIEALESALAHIKKTSIWNSKWD